jgi:hypothetical protein
LCACSPSVHTLDSCELNREREDPCHGCPNEAPESGEGVDLVIFGDPPRNFGRIEIAGKIMGGAKVIEALCSKLCWRARDSGMKELA